MTKSEHDVIGQLTATTGGCPRIMRATIIEGMRETALAYERVGDYEGRNAWHAGFLHAHGVGQTLDAIGEARWPLPTVIRESGYSQPDSGPPNVDGKLPSQ